MDAAELIPGEQVAIVDVTNGRGWRHTSSRVSGVPASSASTAPAAHVNGANKVLGRGVDPAEAAPTN